ncbi:MAG: FAD binding domain-containing protein, partial [Acidobacteria bacterium]|nr:FAD binding domain-containing protein [Acidobacteriota bacterium]
MRAPDFDYRSIETLDEAIAALVEHDDAVALAGGQSLIPMLRLRLARPQLIVDIGRIDGLRDVRTRR